MKESVYEFSVQGSTHSEGVVMCIFELEFEI